MKRRQPSRWLWLAPVSTSLLAGWLTLQGLAPAASPAPSAAAALLMPAAAPAYPAPRVDDAAPPSEPAPTF